ncbi:MAG TPA: DNA polymerase domain-containing protein, partial [Candidatus Acidoferrum sp.]|nr:DNA polymerase domain-containing protein [Candidatus Acidoferrum sp.]
MQSNSIPKIRGWIFDVYPTNIGEMAVWVISENGQRIKLSDKFQPAIYVSAKKEDLETLVGRIYSNQDIASWAFVYKFTNPTDNEKSRVLAITVKDCRKVSSLTNQILKLGDFLRYEVHNCDLHGDRTYFFVHDLFPLAFLEVEPLKSRLKYTLLDSVESVDYSIPPLRTMKLKIEIAKTGKIACHEDPIANINLEQDEKQITFNSGDEAEKLLQLSKIVKELDPDIILTNGGDSYLFSYLLQRATVSNVQDKFILSRDEFAFVPKSKPGRTFFSYGRTFFKAPTTRLYGRVHIDAGNTFILNESSFQGLFEIARICRVPLHTSSRSSIGSSMSSLQFYQAFKQDILIPRNKSIPEAFKSAYELLVADRGGFVYEPKVGIHDNTGEVDFSSMYPSLMVNNNISAETVLCKCCPDSPLRIPDLNYNICEKQVGVVPKALKLIVSKRLRYKRLKEKTNDLQLKEIYENRQVALKWILVTCFGYLGYKNAKFGTIDGHIGVCAFGRHAFLRAARISESRGFNVLHGIVDSLWLKKEDAKLEDYDDLCKEVSNDIGVPLTFEGRYKWIVFLPSKMHPNIGVLNRYYGVMENGKLKVRGLEVRRRDTPRFIYNAQMEMINVFSTANNSKEFMKKIPEALNIVKTYRQKIINSEVPIWDLIVVKHLSKSPKKYKQHVSQAIAAEQLVKAGAEVNAGK